MRVIFALAIAFTTIVFAPSASAAICDNHGVGPGLIYKAACGNGTGGLGARWSPMFDALGNPVTSPDENGVPQQVYRCSARCGGQYGAHTTTP